MSNECGVGRSSVREAFRTLAASGLIVTQPRRSPVVRQFTRQEVIAQFQLRAALEGLAASLAAGRPQDCAGKQSLAALVERMGGAVRTNDSALFLQLNGSFHDMIMELSDNPLISEHVDRTQMMPLRLQSSRLATAHGMAASHADHQAITDAILTSDPDRAETAMRRHIQKTSDALLSSREELFSLGEG